MQLDIYYHVIYIVILINVLYGKNLQQISGSVKRAGFKAKENKCSFSGLCVTKVPDLTRTYKIGIPTMGFRQWDSA